MSLYIFTQVTEHCRRRRVKTQILQEQLAPDPELTLIPGELKHHLCTSVRETYKDQVFSQGIIVYLN